MFKIKQYLMEADTGVEVPSGAEVAAEPVPPETGAQSGAEPPVSQEPQNDRVDAAFAKRLAAEREKLRAELSEQYRDYDTLKSVASYFQEANGLDDVMSLAEQIEMQRLQERAEKANLSPDVQRRLEELESRASRADQLEQEQNLRTWYSQARSELEKFAAEKEVNADDLEKFMIEHRVGSPEIAYKAMKFEDAKSQAEEIKKAAVAEYLQSKKAPSAIGSSAASFTAQAPPKTFQEAEKRALERLRAANNKL